ncbi:MAG: PEP/pyruvate-binding domain-containing protein [Syntrophobacteraceae bacterium]|nr:PEP/pyruvate-binding domain-containing protein [Syntrophobacteraceae bacterium]
MEQRHKYVLWFQECDINSVPVVGGKCASLGELLKANIPVPPGFAVTTGTYNRFLEDNDLDREIKSMLKPIRPEDTAGMERASQSIREMIEEKPISMELQDYIGEFYRLLSKRCQVPAVPVAVRSSATAEDLPGASFAGQQDTFLWVRGTDGVLHHIRKCWSSLFTARAISYRKQMGFGDEQVSISVGIQKMVNAFAAGVMFTLNPGNGDRSTIVIDANWGFGESVVSGLCTPDNFKINKVTLEIMKRTISAKECYFTTNLETQEVEKHECPPERACNQCIIDDEAIELARIGKLIETHYCKPMDIEWALDKDLPANGRVLILQSRPETVWSNRKADPACRPKASAMDHIVAGLLAGKKLS